MTSPLVTDAGGYDRRAIFAKAWRDMRRVCAAGDCGLTFGDWLRNAWRVARAQRGHVILSAAAKPLQQAMTLERFPLKAGHIRRRRRSLRIRLA